jgi:hypothetical protein
MMPKKELGQYMTPTVLAKLVAAELGACDAVLDLAAGDGALIKAVSEQSPRAVQCFGFDIDSEAVVNAKERLVNATILNADGLTASLNLAGYGKIGVVGNPPFLNRHPDVNGWIQKVFPGITGKSGLDRLDVHFLARSLFIAREHKARMVLVMPSGFADGEMCRQIRSSLMKNYHLERCIEVSGCLFENTEAKVIILVVDTTKAPCGETEIVQINEVGYQLWHKKLALEPGERLDASYHQVCGVETEGFLQLCDLNVSITRGLFSRKEAETLRIEALHTTHLSKAQAGYIADIGAKRDYGNTRCVTANAGDILLPRCGKRVSWSAVVLKEGEMPITDHVFRIRAPEAVRELVISSFRHPMFKHWLGGVSKGVCATVLTKKDLMRMPLFALS